MVSRWEVTLRGKKLEREPFKSLALIVFLAITVVISFISFAVGVLVTVVGACLIPLWGVLHIFLRLLGRQGFYSYQEQGGTNRMVFDVSRSGFKKAM